MAQKVRFLLEDIKNKHIVLPEFQREYTWSKTQAKNLLDSMIKKYPAGPFLIWKTATPPALKNLRNFKPEGPVQVLLDGQQRLTALYLLMQNEIPPYYKKISKSKNPRNLYYNLKNGEFKYYKASEMSKSPVWVSVVKCFSGEIIPKKIAEQLTERKKDDFVDIFTVVNDNLKRLLTLFDYKFPLMKVEPGSSLKDALTVFDRVNTGGTPLSDADVALAYMCSNWEDTRREFKKKINILKKAGFKFDLKFMIRAMNAVINGRAYYHLMHNVKKEKLIDGWDKLQSILDFVLGFLRTRAYIYSTGDLNTNNVLIPLIGYLSKNDGEFRKEKNLKLMLYWIYAALYKRRYSRSVDQYLEKDLGALGEINPIQKLISILEEEEGGLMLTQEDLQERGVRHPLYNMSCFVIRKNKGVDWANNLDLSNPFGKKYKVQRHHIFPVSVLKKADYEGNEIHEIANRVPLTRASNMKIFNRKPGEYLPEVEQNNSGNLKRFFIPTNSKLWKVENYEMFLKKRRELLIRGVNDFMEQLLSQQSDENKSLQQYLEENESEKLEFKARLIGGSGNYKLENAVAKTVAGMLNGKGGQLLIGVGDKGEVLGIEKDYQELGKSNRDGFELHLTEILKSRLESNALPLLSIRYEKIDGKTICGIKIDKSPQAVYMKENNEEKFYLRTQNSTRALQGDEADKYKKMRFG